MNRDAVLYTIIGGVATYIIWELWFKKPVSDIADGSTGTGGDATGGDGGDAGATNVEASNFAQLAAAINALAAGVSLPNVQSVTKTVAAGTTELVAGQGGQAIRVLAYCITGSGAITCDWRSGSNPASRWALDLDAPSGKSGANLSTAWPGFLFTTDPGDALNFVAGSAARVSITYWMEGA